MSRVTCIDWRAFKALHKSVRSMTRHQFLSTWEVSLSYMIAFCNLVLTCSLCISIWTPYASLFWELTSWPWLGSCKPLSHMLLRKVDTPVAATPAACWLSNASTPSSICKTIICVPLEGNDQTFVWSRLICRQFWLHSPYYLRSWCKSLAAQAWLLQLCVWAFLTCPPPSEAGHFQQLQFDQWPLLESH